MKLSACKAHTLLDQAGIGGNQTHQKREATLHNNIKSPSLEPKEVASKFINSNNKGEVQSFKILLHKLPLPFIHWGSTLDSTSRKPHL